MRVTLHPRSSKRRPERVPRSALTAQGGETLIEIMVAVVLMAVAFTAILQGMSQSALVAKRNQELTRANVLLSAAADRLLDPKEYVYIPCAPANNGNSAQNNFDTQWADAWNAAGGKGYKPVPEQPLLPTGWRVRIKDMRYLLGPNVRNAAPNASFANNQDNVLEPQWSSWGPSGMYQCFDLRSTVNPSIARDGGLQQIRLVVEKPDGTHPNSYATVDEQIVTKRDQRCPPLNFANADRGPC